VIFKYPFLHDFSFVLVKVRHQMLFTMLHVAAVHGEISLSLLFFLLKLATLGRGF